MKIQSQNKISEQEKDIMSGSVLSCQDEVSFEKRVLNNNKNIVFPLYQKRIMSFEYEFLKSYLYAIYNGGLSNELLMVQNYNTIASLANPVIMAPHISRIDENGLAVIENDHVFVNMKYKNAMYQVSVFCIVEPSFPESAVKYFISVLGIEPDATKNNEVVDFSISEAIKNSYYRNKILRLKVTSENSIDIKEVNVKEFSNERLENIFIPAKIKEELERFYLCVQEYNNIGYGLRYLLCGEPGTGKTKTVRTLINMCYKKATIIIVAGEIDFKTLFNFAKLLEPAIICIDDIDLQFGTREKSYSAQSLGSFLQQLDGFDKNNVFLLATSNDKDLIDRAAQRPGRFDLLIDFSKLNKKNYRDIIISNCKCKEILESFDNVILNDLKSKHVTGAFIVNLIKQLEIKTKLNTGCDIKKYINDFIDISYNGFYRNDIEYGREFGFKIAEPEDEIEFDTIEKEY